MQVVSPVGMKGSKSSTMRLKRAARLPSLNGHIITLIDNSKANAAPFLDRLAGRLEREGARIQRLAKPTAGRQLDTREFQLVTNTRAAVHAFGD